LTGVLTLARREPSALLLAAQLMAVLLYPFMVDNDVGRSLFSVFGIAILGLVVLAVRSTPGLNGVTILLGIPACVLLLIQAITQSDVLLPYSSGFEAVLYFYAAGAMLAYMLEDQRVTRDELFAIGATFTLLAWAFATRTRSARRSIRAASRPRSTRVPTATGWSCCFSASRRCRARALATSSR